MQSLFRGAREAMGLIFPDQCVACRTLVDAHGGLCGPCWRETPFVAGLVCDGCGVPLPGQEDGAVYCDDCLTLERPWARGRAATLYRGTAKRLVLALKHGDRLDLVRPAARWMFEAAAPIVGSDMVAVPVPVHWRRLLSRRYNQAALLSREVARLAGIDHVPDALVRARGTGTQDGKDRERRFANVGDAIAPHPRRGAALAGRRVLLIDDVMTSGATLTAAAESARHAGATEVCVLVLARVARDA